MNVRLRPLKLEDLDNMMTWVNDPDIIRNFAHFDKPVTREEEAKYLENLIASPTDKAYAIETPEGEYLGNIGLHQISWKTRNARLGIILGNKAQWGKGYAQAAIKEIVRLGFEEYNLHKIWAITFTENKRMQHITKKLGFTEEGIMRDEYLNKGVYHDVVRLSILEQEYRGQK